MRLFRYVPGSIVVYLVVAACSAAGPTGISSSLDGGGGSADGSNSGGDAPSLLDALTDPVPPASADTNQSGTRLKVKYYAGDDGSKAFAGFYDSQRKEDCSFRTAADGVSRCMPTTNAVFSGYYADMTCTQPVVVVPAGCSTPTYVLQTDVSCNPVSDLLSVGVSYSGSSIYVLSGTTCTGTSGTGSGAAYFYLGSEVPPSSFVAGTLQVGQ
jgi:hypothetical protein